MKALLLALALVPARVSASDLGLSASVSGLFLRLGVGARAVAMGEAYSAVADDAGAVYWNPAALTRIPKRSALLAHDRYLDSISFDYASYVQSLKTYGAVGGAIEYLSADSVAQTDIAGVETGRYSPNDLALALAYAYRFRENPVYSEDDDRPRDEMTFLDGYSVGFAAKFVRSQIGARSQTETYDVGLLSPEMWERRLRLAFVAQNIGGILRFDQEDFPLPFALKAGLSLAPAQDWLCAIEGVVPRDGKSYGALGVERRFPFKKDWVFFGRAGLNSSVIGETGGISGFSAGLGASYGGYSIDYALVPMGSLGISQQMSLTAKF